MPTSLSSLIDNLTEINNNTKEPEDEFINNIRSMTALLSSHINDLSEINKKEPEKESENEFINRMSSMSTLLSNRIDNLSEINKKEPENKFIDDMRSMLSSLESIIDNVLEIMYQTMYLRQCIRNK